MCKLSWPMVNHHATKPSPKPAGCPPPLPEDPRPESPGCKANQQVFHRPPRIKLPHGAPRGSSKYGPACVKRWRLALVGFYGNLPNPWQLDQWDGEKHAFLNAAGLARPNLLFVCPLPNMKTITRRLITKLFPGLSKSP